MLSGESRAKLPEFPPGARQFFRGGKTLMFGKTRAAAALAVLALATALWAPSRASAFEKGDYFTTFMGDTADGAKIELAAFREQSAIVVEFWASWSPSAMAQHEYLRDAYADKLKSWASTGKFQPEILWVSVSLDRNPADARPHMAATQSSLINVCDGQGFESSWARAFDVKFVPALYIISKEGVIGLASNSAITSLTEAQDVLNLALNKYKVAPGKVPAAMSSLTGNRPATAQISELAPNFSVKAINQNNKTLTLEDFQGKVLLIVVFASWHGGSVEYLDAVYHKLYQPYKGHGFQLLAISIEKEGSRIQSDLIKPNPGKGYLTEFPIGLAPPEDIESMTHVAYPKGQNMPRCYLIGKNSITRDMGDELKIERIKQVLVEDLNVPF
jgi:peroxiredoxin